MMITETSFSQWGRICIYYTFGSVHTNVTEELCGKTALIISNSNW